MNNLGFWFRPLHRFGCLVALLLLVVPLAQAKEIAPAVSIPPQTNPNPPATPVKLIFIHHSTGGNWLAAPNDDQPYGDLGTALMNNNYFVSATNYGWGPDSIGDRTDIPNWPEWFAGSDSSTYLNALYNEGGQHIGDFGAWPRLAADPGGENEVILFKSCFPNSDLYGSPDDPPASAPDDQFTVSNAKAVYNDLIGYFETRQDKLFVVIAAPPMAEWEYSDDYQTPAQRAANARAFNNWLVNEWLNSYPYNNVAVFDYYNVLTSSAGDANTNDAGTESGNHHRWRNGTIEHVQPVENNFSAYPSGDSHPSTAGHQKATTEFVPLLNVFYNRWKSGAPPPAQPTSTPAEATQATPTSTPAKAAQPTPTASSETQPTPPSPMEGGILDDFETSAGDWHSNAETGSHIVCTMDTEMAHAGTASLRLQFEIALYGWVDCGTTFESLQDWRAGDGLSLWARTDNAGQWVTLMLFSGDPNAPTPMETSWQIQEDWIQFVFAWSDFAKAEWADASSLNAVDPSRITGYGFNIFANEAATKGTLWIDDLGLASGEIQPPPQASAPTATPAAEPEATPTPTAIQEKLTPTATPRPVESEPAEPGEPKGRLCTSAIVLPLFAAGIVLTGRPKNRSGRRTR
ncbi:MAG: hypothetical protein JXA89_02565 [Anaerolineae bacterium]|nr:hypothetical protein [Anaerolineae bacterium]